MSKSEFIIKLLAKKDQLLSNYQYQKTVLIDLIKIGFKYVDEHFKNEENKFANMMLQMSLLKANSILQLAEGTTIFGTSKMEIPLIDIQSQSSIFRSLFENYCFFNHLYIHEWNNEEFLVLENIWKITSLTQRFELLKESTNSLSSDNKKKIDTEKEFVSQMTKEIKGTSIYAKNKKAIDNYIKRNRWQLTINDKRIQSISWKDMFENSQKNKGRQNRTYQMFSLDSHPSYFSVFQFGDLYKNRHDLERKTTLMYQTIEMLCNYLFDFKTLLKNEIDIDIETKYLVEILGKDN
ncbi:hypothetical protein EYD45_07905 [Hyunsoonleella flava]|uniref:Uncharacterized protein n=1 Tax=Hyunsoonleella flava TaxID=2527939 RepID=A0A4Q9FH00_9FLAO|nr:hypothetical protein [Hyunsoonleella flava]TBN03931.1 hypothetical protein EYD45_07905 [Hyunsoonleella flava]